MEGMRDEVLVAAVKATRNAGNDDAVVVVAACDLRSGEEAMEQQQQQELARIKKPWCDGAAGLACVCAGAGAGGRFLAAALRRSRRRPIAGGALFFWPLSKPQITYKNYLMEAIGPIASTKDGMYLVGGAPSGNAYIWEVMSGRLLRRWRAHRRSITCLAFSQDDSLFISGSEDGAVCVWSMISLLNIEDSEACGRSPTFIIWSKHESSITGLLTLSGGSSPILISSSLDGTCKVRELLSGRLLQTHVLSVAVNAIATDNDERLLFSGGDDGAIYATKLNIGLQEDQAAVSKDDVGVLSGHKGPITAVAFSKEGPWLISASKDCTSCMWDVKNRRIIRRFNHGKGYSSNLLIVPRSSLSLEDNPRSSLPPRIPILEKTPQQNGVAERTTTVLPSHYSKEDHPFFPGFQASRLLEDQILDLEQERTPEALEMKIATGTEKRSEAITTAKDVTVVNKHLRSRLLDMMQLRFRQN